MSRRIQVQIVGDSASLERAFARSRDSAAGLGSSVGKLSLGFGQLLKSVVLIDAVQKALEGLDATVHLGIENFEQNSAAVAQTAAVLKSTGGVANVSAKAVKSLALELSNLSGISRASIQSGENVLLSFTRIRDFAGKNNDVFTQATKAIVDYSARTGKTASQAALIFGKALEDPASRVAGLARAGIVLSKSQTTAVKSLQATGGVLAAQKQLLKDITDRYAGAAKAAGGTLGGQLNILKQRFADLSGSIVGLAEPAVAKAVSGLTGFVTQLSQTKGAKAKFELTIDAGKNAAEDVFDNLRKQFDAVDWSAVGKTIQDGLRTIPPEIAHTIGSIDFSAVGHELGDKLKAIFKFEAENIRIEAKEIVDGFKQINFGAIGRDLGDAVAKLATFLTEAAQRVDWNEVGRDLVKGAGAIVVAVSRFLAGVPWGKVLSAIGRLVGAAAVGIGRIFLGVGEQLGKSLIQGIGQGLDDLGNTLEKKSIKIVLGIIDPLTSLPSFLGPEGGWARSLKNSLHATLDAMNKPAADDGAAVGTSFAAGVLSAFGQAQNQIAAAVKAALAGSQAAGIGSRNTSGVTGGLPSPANLPAPPPPPVSAGLSASQRNTFFDNAISSDLTRAGFITNIKQQIGALQTIAGLISSRIAATKDVTRRRTLEDQLLSVESQIKGDNATVAQNFLSALSFGVTKAQATASFTDDITAIKALQAGIRKEIAETGATLDLRQQLLDAQQQLVAAQNSARNAVQFKALGLTGTGEDVTPGIKSLKAELNKVGDALKGTFLDTNKTQSLLSQISKILAGGLGAVGQQVRAKVESILEGLDQQLQNHAGNLTKFSHIASGALLSGLGLSPEQIKVIQSRIAQVGSNGSIPGLRSQAFALAGAGSGPASSSVTVHSSTTLVLDGKVIAKSVKTQRQKDDRRRSVSRRGPSAGQN